MAEPLQRFHCEGRSLTEVEIHEDTTRKEGRRLVTVFKGGGPSGDMFARLVKRAGYVAYVTGNAAVEEARYYPSTGRLEFWDKEGKIPANVFAECWSYGPVGKAKEKVQTSKIKHFSCTDIDVKINTTRVDLFNVSPGWVKLHTVYGSGETSDELLQILDGAGYVKLQTKESQYHENHDNKQRWGAGFSGHHVKYFPERKQLQFWSQGGGKDKPAKMYRTCISK